MKIGIQGYYGQENLGDEAILQGILTQLKIDAIFTEKPRVVEKDYNIKGVNTRIYNIKLSKELKNLDLFLLGGGGLLTDWGHTSRSLKKWLRILSIAKRHELKTALIAVGAGNVRFDSSKKRIKKVLNDDVDIITVRDHFSKKYLESFGVEREIHVISDPALLLGTPEPQKLNEKIKVAVCLRHWYDEKFSVKDQEKNQIFFDTVKNVVSHLKNEHDAEIIFVPFRTTVNDDDRLIAKKVCPDEKHLQNTPSTREFLSIARESDIVIGMRLHSLILASSLGTPTIGLEYMDKVGAFMDSIGQKRYSFDLYDLDPGSVIGAVDKTIKNHEKRSREIVTRVDELRVITRDAIKNIGGI